MAKIIFHCYGGSHSSVTTAGIYLKMLPISRVASSAELLGVPHYDQKESVIHGHFRFIGRDMRGNEVYALGKRTAGPDITTLLHKIGELYTCRNDIEAIDTTYPINLLMVIGGFFSRGMDLVHLGRPLVVYGTQLAYPFLVQIAKGVLNKITQNPTTKHCKPFCRERCSLFYICPENDPLPLLLAGHHLKPDAGEQELLEWVTGIQFTGKLGTLKYLGKDDNYELYLAGAGREPEIVARILKETRKLLEIPEINLCIINSQLTASLLLRVISTARKYFSRSKILLSLEKKALAAQIEECRKQVCSIRKSLLEGILD